MDPAYFTSKKELLEFFNNLLDLNLTKIEETAPGAIACQLTNLIFPGSIPMSKVNWGARSDYEFIQNYKLLQIAFTKHHVQRHIDVDKLIRAKYQDNLEWCQWLKAFYEQSGSIPSDDYNPRAVREKGKGGKQYNLKMGGSGSSGARKNSSNSRNSSTAAKTAAAKARPQTTRPAAPTKPAAAAAEQRPSRPLRERSNPPAASTTAAATVVNDDDDACLILDEELGTASGRRGTNANKGAPQQQQNQVNTVVVPDAQLIAENKELTTQVQELTQEVENMESKNSDLTAQAEELEVAVLETESERDYYFDKLRNIEVMLQVFQERGEENDEGTNKLVDDVFKILYATKEDNLVVNDEGEVVTQADGGGGEIDGLLSDSV